MAGIVDRGVSQCKRAVGHLVTANVVQPARQHVEHRLLSSKAQAMRSRR
jgi:hypothetical protein